MLNLIESLIMVGGIENRSVQYDRIVKRGIRLGDVRVALRYPIEADVPPKDPEDLIFDPRAEYQKYMADPSIKDQKINRAADIARLRWGMGEVDMALVDLLVRYGKSVSELRPAPIG